MFSHAPYSDSDANNCQNNCIQLVNEDQHLLSHEGCFKIILPGD